VEPSALPALSRRFKELPVIESVAVKTYTLSSFLDKIAGIVLVSAGILTAFAVIVAVGVVYNSARIALQERAWELASLRVLGFTRAEVAHILFSQFAAEIALAIPIGLVLSQSIVTLIARFHSNESFQIPGVVGARTYVVAVAIVVATAAASAYIVRRRVDRLDLVAVLKTRIDDADDGRSCGVGAGRTGCGRGHRLVCDAAADPGRDGGRQQGALCRQRRRGRQDRIRQRYVVAAPLAGRLTRVRLKAGDPVAADDVVAAILPPPAPLLDPRSRREAEERLGTAEAALERSKAAVERTQARPSRPRPSSIAPARLPDAAHRPCRRWSAPNSRSGSPIVTCGLRNSRIMRRAMKSLRPRRCSAATGMAWTRRPNPGASRRRYRAWC